MRERASRGLRARTAPSLTEIGNAYLAELALRAKPSTLKAARSALALVTRELAGIPDRDALEAWRRARVAQGRSNRTVNRDLTTLGAALGFALERGWVAENPVRKLKRLPQKGRHRRRVSRAYSADDIRRVLDAARSIDARRPKNFPRAPLLFALFETGCRWSELIETSWADLDTDEAMLTLRGETTKTGEERRIPVSPDLFEALIALRTDHVRVTGENPTASSRIFLTPQGCRWPRDTSNFHANFLNEALRVARVPKRDVAGRLCPRSRN